MGRFEIKYLQRKLRAGREFFYFRVVRKDEPEFRKPLPHPTDPDFKPKYNEAWKACFGALPDDLLPAHCIERMVTLHFESEKFRDLSHNTQVIRRRVGAMLIRKWGEFDASAIKPMHCQAIYDADAPRPATANRNAAEASAIFAWGIPRGFLHENPWLSIERVRGGEGYEPWPMDKLVELIDGSQERIVWVALVALYTGQDRGDVIAMSDADIDGEVWTMRRAKTRKRKGRGSEIVITLHSVVLSIIEACRELKREAGIVDPKRPLLVDQNGDSWTRHSYANAWRREMVRLGFTDHEPRLTFKGLRATNATLLAEAAAASSESADQALSRVQAMLGHHSKAMSAHYARRAQITHANAESVLLLPKIGNTSGKIGNTKD
jgi:integrase